MTFNHYQEKSRETAIYPGAGNNIIYPTLGLIGEAGEIANKVKKIQRDDDGILGPITRLAIIDEIGDVLWYLSQLATEIEVSLEEVAIQNIEKLQSRKQKGTLHGSGDSR